MRGKWLLVLCTFVTLLGLGVASASELPLVLSENFDGSGGQLPANWSIAPRGGSPDSPDISKERALSGDSSLRIWRTQDGINTSNWAVVSFGPLKERAVISFSFLASDLERSLVWSLVGADQPASAMMGPSAGPFLSLRNGNVQSYVSAFVDAAPYNPEEWCQVTLDINVTAHTYDILVNGEKANAEPIGYRNSAIDNIGMFGIGYHAASAKAGYLPVYIDNFEVRGK